jgi:hypothetical protein
MLIFSDATTLILHVRQQFDVSPDGRHVLAGWDGQNAEWEARNGDPEDRAT